MYILLLGSQISNEILILVFGVTPRRFKVVENIPSRFLIYY